MKKFLSLLIVLCCFWIVTLKDGKIYQAKDVQGGRWGVTITTEDGTKYTFPWRQVKSIEHKGD